MFADIHTHPHGRIFNWLRDTKYEKKKKELYNPWTIVLSNFKQQSKGGRGFSYSQSDFVKCHNGQVGLVFASLYPMEKGFFTGKGNNGKKKVSRLYALLESFTPFGIGKWIFNNTLKKLVLGTGENMHSLRDFFQGILMRFPLKRINYLQSGEYDYYEELKKEYDFLRRTDKKLTRSEIYIPFLKNIFKNKNKQRKKHPDSLDAVGEYVLARDYQSAVTTIDQGKIAAVLTIEGMHALGTDTHLDKVLERIDEIKKWEHPVFFITFAHHFNNYLCGHAHSIIKAASLLTDQKEAMNGPFTEMGLKAVRRLLSLDDNNKKSESLGRRILVDLKHTSATSRQEFYQQVVEPAMAERDVIPVICSHVAYSGIKTLNEFIANYDKEKDDYEVDSFNAWNINVCDEDIEMILKTKGLLGLCFDQRIMGQVGKEKADSKTLAWRNIKAFLDAAIGSNNLSDEEKARIWDVICLGSDFEGYIDPVDEYATVLDYQAFKKDMTSCIREDIIDKGASGKYFIDSDMSAEALAGKICFDNALNFLKVHFK